jgi:hypothetical protein
MTSRRKLLFGALQLVLLGAALWFLVDTAREHWGSVRDFELRPRVGPLLAGSLITMLTYVYVVIAWRYCLSWWGASLRMLSALRIYFVSNLARFIPGTVWQFVGLGAMAVEEGISPLAATGAVLLQQMVLLATGLAVALAGAPELMGGWARDVPRGAMVASVLGAVVFFALAVPSIVPSVGRLLERVMRRPLTWPRPRVSAFAGYVLALVVPWLAYGVGFWLFAVAFLGDAAPSLGVALTAYTASYVAGLIAVFAPGGIIVREAALVGALAPMLGAQNALFLAIGSRLWLLFLEVITAMGALVVYRFVRHAPAIPPRAGG